MSVKNDLLRLLRVSLPRFVHHAIDRRLENPIITSTDVLHQLGEFGQTEKLFVRVDRIDSVTIEVPLPPDDSDSYQEWFEEVGAAVIGRLEEIKWIPPVG